MGIEMIRAKTFEKAADLIIDKDWGTCTVLTNAKSNNSEHELWKDAHSAGENDWYWFGCRFQTKNQLLREQLLREMAFNLRNYGY